MHQDKKIFGHPVGLFVLSATEMWERFSYYGMSAILILFLTSPTTVSILGWSGLEPSIVEERALSVLGWYLMLIYLTPILGGFIADYFWGQRKSILLGGFMMMVGKLILAMPLFLPSAQTANFIYLGLGLNLIGNGLFKPNISTLIGDLYSHDDPKRDSAFTVFYMGINLGAFLAFLILGYVGEKHGYELAFLLAAIGMGIGILIQLALMPRYLGNIGEKKHFNVSESKAGFWESLKNTSSVEKQNILKICFFSALSIIFWMGFEQSSGTLTLFAKNETNLMIAGFEIPASWLRLCNPFFVFACAPLITIFWDKLGSKQPTAYGKYIIGFFLLSLCFIFPIIGLSSLEEGQKAPIIWLVLTYFFMTLAELCISPVGLSLVTFYAPARLLGTMMGIWFLATSLGSKFSASIGFLFVEGNYNQIFLFTSGISIFIAIILWVGNKAYNKKNSV